MEKIGRGRGKQRSREQSSPERGRAVSREVLKKVQLVYYLTQNGQLEHPHFMEVYHLPYQPLCLKDFIAKLIVVRGRGMPYQYSWSCRRSYKNGYVWNDLSANDIIYPSQGTEYILKGSEIVHYSCTAETERHHQIQSERRPQIIGLTNPMIKLNPIRTKDLRLQAREHDYSWKAEKAFGVQEDADLDECEEKTSSNAPPCLSSKDNCSSKKLGQDEDPKDDHHSPTHGVSCEKLTKLPSAELTPRRRSILFQLIACRFRLVAAKGKSIPSLKQQISRGEAVGLHKEVVNLQLEEKEYFSGSILETMKEQGTVVGKLPLNKSSYKEERNIPRRSITILEEARAEAGDEEGQTSENGDKITCIPNLRRTHHKEFKT